MAHNLYTLSYRKTTRGTVFIDGPYDKWGYIVKEMHDDPKRPDNVYFLIRGTGSTERK